MSSKPVIEEKHYIDTFHHCGGEFDGKMSINKDNGLLSTDSLLGGAIDTCESKRKVGEITSPKDLTSPFSPPCTPALQRDRRFISATSRMIPKPERKTMTAVKWLQTFISPLPSKPSAVLERFLSSCDKNVTEEVISRAKIIVEAIFPCSDIGRPCINGGLNHNNLIDSFCAERRPEALKLYYRVLESICTSEAQKLPAGNLTCLLNNERFHRCLLSCSAEVISASYKTTSFLFPMALARIGITSFDMSKVIETFIRNEESLPRELKRHLNSLDEQILESKLWEKGSTLYNDLMVARPSLSAEIIHLGLLAEPMPSLDAIATHHVSCGSMPQQPFSQKHTLLAGIDGDVRSPKRMRSEYCTNVVDHKSLAEPMKDCLPYFNTDNSKLPSLSPHVQSTLSSPMQPSSQPGKNTCVETRISILFSKMEKLAAIRINSIAEHLKLSQHIRESIHRLFRKILVQQTSLFFNRHINKIILCCFYGVAKVSGIKLTFKEIFDKHIKTKPVYSLMKNKEDFDSTVAFYNKIFVLAVRPLLNEICTAGASNQVPEVNNNDNCPGSPQISPFKSIPDISPKKISPSHNIYLSPLQPSKKNALVSNWHKSFYACVGESTRPYQTPSKDLDAINNHLKCMRKPRGKLNFDNPGVQFVSDSLVTQCLFPSK